MKRSIGIVCMILGVVMLLGAGALHLMNTEEGNQAQESVEKLMPQLMEAIHEKSNAQSNEASDLPQHEAQTAQPIDPNFYSTEMTEEIIDGYGFVGYLSVPSLELKLPVMSQSDDARLKISPCRFSGSTKTDDLVIGGHNYWQHFGQLPDLKNGAIVTFTDMDGKQTTYELITMEVLEPNDVQELTKGEYPLTLFTCTYGGSSRITLRFDIVKN
ncbi:MAG: sortase [Ruminococcaceae bacterium]|nr:sortase [Oscillospiraceae bacterium]